MSDDEKTDSHFYYGEMRTDSLKNFFIALLNDMMLQIDRLHIKDDYWERTIPINTGKIRATDFNLSEEQKMFLLEQGEKAALKYFDINN